MRDEKLIRIPLQFFGGSDGDEFDDDLGYEDDEYDSYDEDDGGEAGDGNGGEADDGNGGDATSELIAELKAAGYVGDDLAALTADMKKKRESGEKRAASNERRSAMSEGKGHIKSGKPARGASGEGIAGFTERDISEVNACLKNPSRGEKGRARSALERVNRAISK